MSKYIFTYSIDNYSLKRYDIHMEFIEMETKEDILALACLERECAPEFFGDGAEQYLTDIEHTVRMESEAGVEYYLIYSGGPAAFFALVNEGPTVTLTKLAVAPECRRRGIARRAVAFIRDTYDPTLLRIYTHGAAVDALSALGFERAGEYYEKRYE